MEGGKGGLEGVVACATEICFIDGDAGRLLYRGYEITDLVESRASFEDVAHLLWMGCLPTRKERTDLCQALDRARDLSPSFEHFLRSLPIGDPMTSLRTAVSALGLFDGVDTPTTLACATWLTGRLAAIVAAQYRLARRQQVVASRSDFGHAANVLYMLFGREPSPLEAHVLDVMLVLHADHELNASTFAARVCSATLADMYAAITSAVGTLSGPLHGAANAAANRALEEIGEPERAAGWVREHLARGEKIPGFGHRVYRHRWDPRAVILRSLARDLAQQKGDQRLFAITEALERAVEGERAVYPNVDLYSGVVYRLLGIDAELFTPLFAVARVVGWTAHVMEQYAHNRIIRPRAEYVGPQPRRVADERLA